MIVLSLQCNWQEYPPEFIKNNPYTPNDLNHLFMPQLLLVVNPKNITMATKNRQVKHT